MPSIDVPVKEASGGGTISQAVIGIIYPPPEVRNIVDKTASFVARNGPEFEARIRQNELGNPKFNFLNTGDPYHAYYQHRVKEIRDGKSNEPGSQVAPKPAVQQKQQELMKQAEQKIFVPKEAPPEFEFVADPPSISALDLDIVKLTAQFAARNGRAFLTNLMNREQRNFQFDFLRPQHSLFLYFIVLLKQYTKVLLPSKDVMGRLKDETESKTKILEQVKYRSEWIRYQELQRAKEEEALERERVAYAQVDWHDFVVVETVDYQQHEPGNFPPPTTPDDVGARVIMQERIEDGQETEMMVESEPEDDDDEAAGEDEPEDEGLAHMEDLTIDKGKDNNQVQDMEEESSSSSDDEDNEPSRPIRPASRQYGKQPKPPGSAQVSQPLPLPPSADKVIVKKGYDPKQAHKKATISAPSDEYLISPITGESIPASKVQEHMRIGLLDPRWVEQRDKFIQEKINQDTVYAPGAAIEASLKQLAERRTDIFGIGDEETAIGKKIGEEDTMKDNKVTWDGHTSSVEAATRAARANITLEDQIHQIHKVKGLLPDEEKEKIGPKPVTRGRGAQAVPPQPIKKDLNQAQIQKQAVLSSKPTSAPAAAPVQPVPQPAPPVMPPVPTQMAMPPGLMAQPPMMMMPMRPMMGYPVAAPPVMRPGPPIGPTGYLAPPGTLPEPPGTGKHAGGPLDDDDPMAKRARNEDGLMPEQEFMARQKNKSVMIKILAPVSQEKPEWRLNGQMIAMVLPLADTVAVVKSRIHDETGMPPGKQKLSWEGLFLKDSNSLAYYNVSPGSVFHLQVKERGGRKK